MEKGGVIFIVAALAGGFYLYSITKHTEPTEDIFPDSEEIKQNKNYKHASHLDKQIEHRVNKIANKFRHDFHHVVKKDIPKLGRMLNKTFSHALDKPRHRIQRIEHTIGNIVHKPIHNIENIEHKAVKKFKKFFHF